MAKVFDANGSKLTLPIIAAILRTLETDGEIKVKNVAKGDGDILLRMGAALQRRYRRDWRNRGLTDEEWALIRRRVHEKCLKQMNSSPLIATRSLPSATATEP